MKKIYFLSAIVLMAFNTIAQIEGTWRLAPAAGSLAVGPNQGDGSWCQIQQLMFLLEHVYLMIH